jgi:hypothetical protein
MGPNASLSDRTLILTALIEIERRADSTDEDESLKLRPSICSSNLEDLILLKRTPDPSVGKPFEIPKNAFAACSKTSRACTAK